MSYKIGIVGCGNVGISYAYSLVNQGLDISEIVLIDIDEQRTIGKAKIYVIVYLFQEDI